MLPDYSRFLPYLIGLLALWLVYRRLRRSFGRQLLQPRRMWMRLGMLTVFGTLLIPTVARSTSSMAIGLAGLAAGAALGLWGARHTRYQEDAGKRYYVPHTGTGIVVSLLLVTRVIYRIVEFGRMAPSQAGTTPWKSPLTVALLFVVVGYYVCYYGVVLRRAYRMGPEDLEVVTTSTAAPTST